MDKVGTVYYEVIGYCYLKCFVIDANDKFQMTEIHKSTFYGMTFSNIIKLCLCVD